MKKNFFSQLRPTDHSTQPAFWFIFRKEEILLSHTENTAAIPRFTDITTLGLKLQRRHYLGEYGGAPCYAAQISDSKSLPTGMLFQTLRHSYTLVDDEDLFSIASRAKQILNWDETTQFCTSCGGAIHLSEKERAKLCLSCDRLFYPQISPVVLTLIWRENEILLARSPHFQKDIYSVLAGFVEPGETLEYAAERETREEVSISIKNLRYFGSQPWPFPSNLMIGFMAEYKAGEIVMDSTEIEDAQWFNVAQLPSLPNPLSLSRRMIDAFLA